MNIDHLLKQYWFHDGALKSFHLDIENNRIEITLSIRRVKNYRPLGPMQEEDLEPCTLQLIFENLSEMSLFNRFPTQGYYLNFSTFNNTGKGIEVSFNIHDSSSHVYDHDNWIIKAKQITWKEL